MYCMATNNTARFHYQFKRAIRATSAETLPPSSYRLGATSARLDQLYPPPITAALRAALSRFARQLDGFVHEDAVLYGVRVCHAATIHLRTRHKTASVAHSMKTCGQSKGPLLQKLLLLRPLKQFCGCACQTARFNPGTFCIRRSRRARAPRSAS